MANVTFQSTTLATPPAATTVATETIGGGEYQLVKLVDGLAGSTTPVRLPNEVGTWNYVAGTLTASGNKTGVGRCLHINVRASGLLDGSFNVNGGNTLTVRSGTAEDLYPRGNVSAPVVNWVSGTIDILIEGLS